MKTSTETHASPAAALAPCRLHGPTMGTRYTALFHTRGGVAPAGIARDLFAAVDAVDRQMSTWRPDSDLCRLNAAPLDTWQPLPAPLATVLDAALHIERESRGAFDINVGELVDAWGFGPHGGDPDAASIGALRGAAAVPASAALEVDGARARVRKHAPVALDLSGIAKGFGVDALARCLDRHGIDAYLVGIDGELRARGTKPDGAPWKVAIERPLYGLRDIADSVALRDAAIATSGDYRHWVTTGGRRFSHTMRPASRGPLGNRLAAVTVVAASALLADAWATALMVLGEHDGPALARARGMQALFVLRDGEQLCEQSIGTLFQ